MKQKTARGEAAAFFEEAIAIETDECILWPFSKKTNGYADIKRNGRMNYVHRLMCLEAHGLPPTDGLEAAHSCGVRHCINKKHLRWATHKENHADRIMHGTSNRGAANGNAKLTAEGVLAIRARFCAGESRKSIAKDFGIQPATVTEITGNRVWGWVA